jgi:hypothetical protein
VHNVKKEIELRVVTPNEPGILGRVLGTLANASVNLIAMCAFSEDKKGIFYILTSDYKKAEKALTALGYEVKTNPVITVIIDDRIGAGAEIGALLGNAIVDINYCYGSSAGLGKALLVFSTNNHQRTIDALS